MLPLRSFAPLISAGLVGLGLPVVAEARGRAEHVVVVVFDGLRPDFVTPQYCPNLYSLATNGVFFRKHHPVFVSTTIVNGTALATGTHPGRSGIIANSDYRQELNFTSAVASEALDVIRRGDLLSGGRYVAADTVAELIQDAGFHTYIAGTKGVTLLHDRSMRRTDTEAHKNSVTLGRGLVMPRGLGDSLKKANEDKGFPDAFTTPNYASDHWTTRALVNGLWKKGVPKYSLLWLTDPDVTQHAKGVGSGDSIDAIQASDKNLGHLLKALDERKLREKTDIMVVSDHGFSQIQRAAEITATLRAAGLTAHSKIDNPEKDDVIVVSLGGAALVYVVGRDEAVIRRATTTLQQSDFAGVIFSRLLQEGTFPLEAVRYSSTNNGPDLVVSMRWSGATNEHGFPGLIVATGGSRDGGTHGSLSAYDMNNTLVASGPDFRRGHISRVPSGNIDLAPTILDLLGIRSREPMDGRVLREAYAGADAPAPKVDTRRLEAARTIGFMRWNQYLQISEVDGATYFDEGNGTATLE
jgi:predicted AlkP superfamily pyrophosphatase or phosphodiesterase